jgi:putative transposase
MGHACVRNYVHIVFSTRDRRHVIREPIREKLWDYMRGIGRNYNVDVKAIGGVEDHAHVVIALPPRLSLADAVRVVKANSSKWMSENGHWFSWQDGYAAFSVSVSNLAAVCEYVRNQEEHHRKRTFDEELEALLKKHGFEHRAAPEGATRNKAARA